MIKTRHYLIFNMGLLVSRVHKNHHLSRKSSTPDLHTQHIQDDIQSSRIFRLSIQFTQNKKKQKTVTFTITRSGNQNLNK